MISTATSWRFIVSPRGHVAWPVADWVRLSSAVCILGRASSVECSITASLATTASVVAVCQSRRCKLEYPYELDDNSLCSCLFWFQDAHESFQLWPTCNPSGHQREVISFGRSASDATTQLAPERRSQEWQTPLDPWHNSTGFTISTSAKGSAYAQPNGTHRPHLVDGSHSMDQKKA